jgi:archaellin
MISERTKIILACLILLAAVITLIVTDPAKILWDYSSETDDATPGPATSGPATSSGSSTSYRDMKFFWDSKTCYLERFISMEGSIISETVRDFILSLNLNYNYNNNIIILNNDDGSVTADKIDKIVNKISETQVNKNFIIVLQNIINDSNNFIISVIEDIPDNSDWTPSKIPSEFGDSYMNIYMSNSILDKQNIPSPIVC